MKLDIKDEFAIAGDQYVSFTQTLYNLAIRIQAFAIQYWQTYLLRCAIASERKALVELSDIELDDIGIKRSDAIIESQRAFSDLPDNRLN